MCGICVKPKKLSSASHLTYRGPDNTIVKSLGSYEFTFHRLSIIDPSHAGDQPFESEHFMVICNGEIFNHKLLRKVYEYNYRSHSDCEVLLPMLALHPLEKLCHLLDGEFAFVAYDKQKHCLLAARDPMGIRPLFFGYSLDGEIAFASEAKELLKICSTIQPVKPGHYFDGKEFKSFTALYSIPGGLHKEKSDILTNIRQLLIEAVEKRLDADVPIGYLLSGGLDSSLVCAIAQRKSAHPIPTFAIGLDHNPIDLKYAKQAANYLGTDHCEVIFRANEIENILRTVIWHTETWDVTTIRASIPMFLLCRYIRNQSSVRVVLSGEVSDELFGYKYTDFAPSASEFQKEAQKRIQELYMYDVLRADRCISGNGLEARVPFSDKYFVEYVMNIDPDLKLNKVKMGKYLLRQAFAGLNYLPDEILWRDKAAFSDAVGHGLVDALIALADKTYSDSEFHEKQGSYTLNPPLSKEGLLYRELFREMFLNQDHLICGYWLPNRQWPHCDLNDPSARHLPNYGASGK